MDRKDFKYNENFSLVDYVSTYLPVNVYDSKTGNNSLGKRGVCSCPFCTKSGIYTFIISDKENKYNCFSCKKTGDGIDFIMKLKGYDINKAMDDINKAQGIESHYSKEHITTNNDLYVANELAKKCYHSNLKSNKDAYLYFRDRGISDKTINKFQLGYSSYGMSEILNKQGYSDDVITNSGIGKIEDGKYKDKIFHRIMFPIMVNEGDEIKTVGFGGRVMKYPDEKNPNAPKYLNTSNTPIFDKSSTLYAFNFAEKSNRKGMVLCEGYMDVISLHQAGFDNAVASLGTAFTRNHALMIKKVKDTVYLCFDSDEAGTKAKLKAIPILKGAGLEVKVLDCSPYKDPDELIKAEGNNKFQQVINNAIDSYVYEVEKLKETSEDVRDFENKFVHMIFDLNEKEYKKYLEAYDYIKEKTEKDVEEKEFNSYLEEDIGFNTLGDELVKNNSEGLVGNISQSKSEETIKLRDEENNDEQDTEDNDAQNNDSYSKRIIDEYEFDIGFDSL